MVHVHQPGRLSPEPDFVIVGAGSSGCVLVHRLTTDPSVRVLVLEAGISGESDSAVVIPGRWVSLMGSSYDWTYTTEHEPGLAHRRLAFPRGRAHGGSSAINAMAYVRGSRVCFDRWRELGNPGWGYDDLLPLFARAESRLAVSQCRDPHASHDAFLVAAAEQGFVADPLHDFNGPEPEGVAGFYQKNILHGQRHSTAAAFLTPALARPNVEIRSPVHATRLVLEGHRVVGVEYLHDGRLERVRARREVVLCAGAVDTPRLLMLSGIGAADDLRAHGIPVVADLPGVGRNLQDHPKLSVRWTGKTALPGSTVTAGLFTRSSSASVPDLQFYVGRGIDEPDAFVTITVSLVQPRSHGTIEIRSADPLAAPVIRANYLTEPPDVEALVEGARLARRLGESHAYDRLRAEELEPGMSMQDLTQFARSKADTIYHPAGTCRMGPATDRDAVVDSHLRVHGIEGVRVADASIMPTIVNAPTHAACVMIGEKCAAIISGQ
jgi:choline dehydrogenase-like flavoprotein